MNSAKRKEKALHPDSSRKESLECIPVQNPQVSEQAEANGEIRLIYQVEVRPWFHGALRKITGSKSTLVTRNLQLDLLGSAVWRMIDGRKSVQKIIDEFKDIHSLNRREAEVSVTAFFKELGKRGLLAMRDKK